MQSQSKSRNRGQVVVGSDGSLPSRRAVRWAAEEAGRRGIPLRIVTVAQLAEGGHAHGVRGRLVPWLLTDADAILRDAVDLAAETLPEDEIVTVVSVGPVVDALVDESESADLLVVGNRGLDAVTALMLGSVSVEVAERAACPMVVVRGSEATDPHAPVVVGMDGSARSGGTLAEAFKAAEAWDAPLLAVHAWHAPAFAGSVQAPAAAYQGAHRGEDEACLLSAVLKPCQEAHPTVQVATRAVEGRAAEALVGASAGARLLVVCPRGRGELAGLMLGSTSQSTLRNAPCPVLLVPAPPRQHEGSPL